ncbi:MAG: glycosyltransferase family 2 protein, partial [Bacteroidaceae bacterium]|nr:glycosyltransferase family 2 protein [Bacteroidaceae bacterium]
YIKYEIQFFEGVNKWEDVGVVSRLRYYSKKTIVIEDSFYHYNKLNSQSIVSVYSIKKIEEQMRCASLLDIFFRDKGDSFLIVRYYLKFISKSDLLFIRTIRDAKRWKNTFEETHNMIWKFVNLPINIRLIFWLASKGFFNVSCFLIDIKQFIYKLKHR